MSQNVVNNGGDIVVKPGAYFIISESYINKNDGTTDAEVDLDGTIILGRNWVNNANNNVLVEIGTSPMGEVIMNGNVAQKIIGTNPTFFENLTLRNAEKILEVSDCEVYGRLTIDAILDLNSEKIIIANRATDGITYVSKYILSETTPDEGYGEVQWNIRDRTSTYQIPFGSGQTEDNDLNLTLAVNTAGDDNGNISFATYHSGCHSKPFPTFVQNIDRAPQYIADRFWIIDPYYLTTKPGVDITFKYTDLDVFENCNERIEEKKLKAIRYNTLKNTWSDMPMTGIAYENNNAVQASNIASGDLYAPWTLVNEVLDWELFVANTFSPNNDGNNDLFFPQGINLDKFETYDFYIFNRWGEIVFNSQKAYEGWNGTFNNNGSKCPVATYVWLLMLTDIYGEVFKYQGIVNVIR